MNTNYSDYIYKLAETYVDKTGARTSKVATGLLAPNRQKSAGRPEKDQPFDRVMNYYKQLRTARERINNERRTEI